LHHIVENYDRLADWTVFTQAGEPSFGYKGHRSGGGHLLAGDDFANYLEPQPSGSRFVYTSAVHLPSMNHLLRASYCIADELLEGEAASMCPTEASQWTPWWDVGDFKAYVASKIESQHGEQIMDFYHKYINPEHVEEDVIVFFPQGARFSVSKETIQSRPKMVYERLLATVSQDEDPYAGYFMEWLWSELFKGHQEPCSVPPTGVPVSHTDAMRTIAQRFPRSMERQLSGASSQTGSDVGIAGGVSGTISGGISGGVSSTPTKVAGTMEVEFDIMGDMEQSVVENMFKEAIAEALEIPIDNVVKLEVSEINQGAGLRRLQSTQTKRYEISYEVLPLESMDPDVFVARANHIFEESTVESQAFYQTLTNKGVTEIRQVVPTLLAYKISDTTTTTTTTTASAEDVEANTTSQVGLVVLGVTLGCITIAVVVAVVVGILMKHGIAKARLEDERERDGRAARDAAI
jgi:hypothetical protein